MARTKARAIRKANRAIARFTAPTTNTKLDNAINTVLDTVNGMIHNQVIVTPDDAMHFLDAVAHAPARIKLAAVAVVTTIHFDINPDDPGVFVPTKDNVMRNLKAAKRDTRNHLVRIHMVDGRMNDSRNDNHGTFAGFPVMTIIATRGGR